MTVTVFTQHMPPSVNACYSNARGKGRIKTERYRQWENAAGYDCKRKGTVPGAFQASIIIDRGLRPSNGYIDNRVKPILDLLQAHGIIDNDKYCERVSIEWGEADGGIVIRIEPYVGNVEAAA